MPLTENCISENRHISERD